MPMDPKHPELGTIKKAVLDLERKTGRRSPKLDAAENIPPGFEYLASVFWELRSGASDGFGGIRITWQDMRAYQELTGIALDAFEIEAIMEMDQATTGVVAEAGRAGDPDS